MFSPVEVVLKPLKLPREEAIEYLVKQRESIEALLNISLFKDPGKIWNNYYMKVRSIRKDFKELCYSVSDGEICLYQYKEISAKSYIKTPLLAAMRGTVVKWYSNEESRLLAFPFAKFFNYGEVPETQQLPSGDFLATEKLDGTLIIAWRDENGELHFNTRGLLEWFGVKAGKTGMYMYKGEGIENPYVRAFVSAVKRMSLWHELESLVKDNTTVMFELVGRIPASQAARAFVEEINPDDPSWTPYALARRDNLTFKLEYIRDTAFPTPEGIRADSHDHLINLVKHWKDKEGVVLFYPHLYYRNGELFKWWNYMVKLKSPRYMLRSEIFIGDRIWWRGVARYTILGMHDDLVSLLDDQEAKEFVKRLHAEYVELREIWEEVVEQIKNGALTEEKANYIENNLKMKWLLPYLEEGAKRGESVLKKLLIENLPKNKEAILSFVRRVKEKLRLAKTVLSS